MHPSFDIFGGTTRKFILMQQLRYIKRELNLERDDKQSIIAAFKDSSLRYEQ